MKAIRQSSFFFCAILACAVLAGCGRSPRYHTEVKPGFDLSPYRTFAVAPMTEPVPGIDPSIAERAEPIVVDAVRATLKAKGYKEAKLDEADFIVVINAAVIPRTNVRAMGFPPAYEGSGWYSAYPDLVSATDGNRDKNDDAAIAVQVYDRKTKDLVWFSVSSSIRRGDDSNSSRIGRARDLAIRLISEFPTSRSAS